MACEKLLCIEGKNVVSIGKDVDFDFAKVEKIEDLRIKFNPSDKKCCR